jgi:hypothetical protein
MANRINNDVQGNAEQTRILLARKLIEIREEFKFELKF